MYRPTLLDDADESQAFFRQRRPPQTAPAQPAPSVRSAQQFVQGDQGIVLPLPIPFIPRTSGADEGGALGFRANASGGSIAHRPPSIQQPQVSPHQFIPPEYSAFGNPITPVPAMSGFQNIGNGPGGSTHALQVVQPRAHEWAGEYYGPSQRYYVPSQTGAVQPYGPLLAPAHLGESEGATASVSRLIAGQCRYAKNVDAPRVPLPVQGDEFIALPKETEATSLETENGLSAGGKAKAKKRSRAADTADGTQPKLKKKNKGKQKAQEQNGTGDAAPQAETRRPTNVIPLEPAALYMSYDAEREAQRVHDENYYPFAYVFPEAGPDGRDVVYRLTDETAAPVPEEEGCVYELVYIVSDVPWEYTQGATPNGPLVLRPMPTPEYELPITMDAVYRKYTTRIPVVPLKTDDITQGTTRTRKLADGDVACDECDRPHKDSVGAKNAHQKRWHNDWITSISMNECACILCGNAVHTEPDQFRRHRKGEEGFRQCSYVVESEGWVHRMGVWLVMHYPELVLMVFKYWQFGYDFRDQLREWWAEETIARTATWLWYEHVGRQQIVVDGKVQVEIGMPLWQYYIHDLGLEMSEEGHHDEDGDRADDDASNAEE